MSSKWIFSATLMLGACGGSESDTGAIEVQPDGTTVGVSTLDLTRESGSFVVDVDADGDVGAGLDVTRRNGRRMPLQDWLGELGAHNNVGLISSDDGKLVFVRNSNDPMPISNAESQARDTRDQIGFDQRCPQQCMHCPEDNVFLCAALCAPQP